MLQYTVPANRRLVAEALHEAHREDLIGYERRCLIKPERPKPNGTTAKNRSKSGTGPKKAAPSGKPGRRSGK